ncbi:hypothetical protein MHU86_14600 [Fragilaria crotonensis]|nr:hypothetical protein MHU86_14600 [Fragilaria crotonensis]
MKLESPSPSQRETVKTLSPSVAPVIHETPSPTDFPSEMPLSTPAPSEAGDATSGIDPTLVSLFVDLSTHDDGAALKSSSTPQNDALHWLAQDPSLDSYSDEQKVQRFVLATLFYSTDGPDWVNSDGWISDINECTWFSYTELCDGSGNLLQVDLRENSLLGTLPVELSWLESLEKLNLKDNSLYGQIPREFGEFKSLAYLQFARNDLTGTLPTELARVTNLETIGLSGNALEGEIPTQYAALTLLARLRLDENNFSGNIPTEFGSMTSLELVDLFGNSLKGTIPTELGGLPRLANLTVSDNSLSGTMPDELCSQADAIYIAADCDEVDCPCCSEC